MQRVPTTLKIVKEAREADLSGTRSAHLTNGVGWVISVVSTSRPAADSALHPAPAPNAHNLSARLDVIAVTIPSVHRSPLTNRLRRSVIASVTALHNCQQERLAVRQSRRAPGREGQMAPDRIKGAFARSPLGCMLRSNCAHTEGRRREETC